MYVLPILPISLLCWVRSQWCLAKIRHAVEPRTTASPQDVGRANNEFMIAYPLCSWELKRHFGFSCL